MRFKTSRMALAFLPILLAGCATSGVHPQSPDGRFDLAAVPADIRRCFDEVVPRPAGDGGMSQKQVTRVIADLKQSEKAKTDCGKRLLHLYDSQSIGGSNG